MANFTPPPESETTPYVPSGTSSSTPQGFTVPSESETTPYVPGAGTTAKPSAPVTWSGIAAQLGRGAESGAYHVAGMIPDYIADQAAKTKFAWDAAKDLYHLATTGEYGDKPTLPNYSLPGGSESLMGRAGQVSPQLDPRNYPAQNLAERIARTAGDVGVQAATGRLGGTGFSTLRGAPLPSAVTIGKQLAGATVAGAGAGTGAQTGREVAGAIPSEEFRLQHPLATQAIEDVGGVIGGMGGGYLGSGIANKTGFAAGPAAFKTAPKDLTKLGADQMNMARSIPANFKVQPVQQSAFNLQQSLQSTYGSGQIGPVISKIDRLLNPPAGYFAVPFHQLDSLSNDLAVMAKKNVGTPLGAAANDASKWIENFSRNSPPSTYHSGNPDLVARWFNVADQNYAAGKRGEKLEQLQDVAELPGKPSVRQQVANLVDPRYIRKRLYGFSDEDKQALERYTKGTPFGTFLESIGEGGGPHESGFGRLYPIWEGAKLGAEHLGPFLTKPVGALVGAATYPTIKWGARKAAPYFQPQLSPIIEQTMQRAPGYVSTPASPFRTTVPVGLGAISGLSGQ